MEQQELDLCQPSTSQIVAQLKKDNQDFEWYPTTNEMLEVVASDIVKCNFWGNRHVFMDIGCGDGRVLKFIRNYRYTTSYGSSYDLPFCEYLGIEKSETHLKNLVNSNVTVIGTEFWETSLIDKQSSVIFCNPPYSEYAQWMEAILLNGFALSFYFIVPERWKNNENIEKALKRRNLQADIIFEGDFLNGERSARAKINIVRVASAKYYRSFRSMKDDEQLSHPNFNNSCGSGDSEDPFNNWFDDLFKFDLSQNEYQENQLADKACKEIFVKSNNIQELADWYNKDLAEIQKNYNALSGLDPALFKELGVNIETLKNAVRNRFKSLKNRYWNNFINYYDPIRSRLTQDKRRELQGTLLSQISMLDFTVKNMLYITELVISEVNTYFNDQIIEFYEKLASLENIKMYKSNQKVFTDNYDWRYNRDKTPYKLECRIITTGVSESYYTPRLHDVNERLNDICIILKSIGFNAQQQNDFSSDARVPFGEKLHYFEHNLTTGDIEEAFEVKFFKNGNCHIKFRKDIMLAINVVVGRLLGWVTSAGQAAEEMGEDLKEVQQQWHKSDHLMITNKTQLLGLPKFE